MSDNSDRINSFLLDFTKCIMHHYEQDTNESLFISGDRSGSMISVELEKNLVALINELKYGKFREKIYSPQNPETLTEAKLKTWIERFGAYFIRVTVHSQMKRDVKTFLAILFAHSIIVCFWVKTCAVKTNNYDCNFIGRHLSKLTDTFNKLSEMGYLEERVWDAIPNWKHSEDADSLTIELMKIKLTD